MQPNYFDKNKSYWAEIEIKDCPKLEKSVEADIAVIGAGFTGLSAAYHILKNNPEKKVVVLEAVRAGHGASGRNGGMLLSQPESEFLHIGSDEKTHKMTYDATVDNMSVIERLMKKYGYRDDMHLRGNAKVIVKEKHVEKFKRYVEKANLVGIPVEFRDREKTIDVMGTDVFKASVYDPNGGEIHPVKLVHALKKAAMEAGAEIYEHSPVTKIIQNEVITLNVGKDGTSVTAKNLVLATNGYSKKIGYMKSRIIPVHTRIGVTPPLPGAVFNDLGWKNRIPFFDSRNRLFHTGSTTDGRIAIGAGGADYFFNSSLIYKRDLKKVEQFLLNELKRIFPALGNIGFDYLWTGVLCFSLDFTQSVGVGGKFKNIYHGVAYCGHGVNCAVLFGRIIADLYAGDLDKWKDMPFINNKLLPVPPEPLAWVGIKGYMEYLRLIDRM